MRENQHLTGTARQVVWMDRLLRRLLSRFICRGSISFTTADGTTFRCGDGTGMPIAARFLTRAAERRVLTNPELALGEIYMDGSFVVQQGSIADLLAVVMDQPAIVPGWAKAQWWLRHVIRYLRQLNIRARSRQNVAHHYDLDDRLYTLFLDADRQYSCGYFEHAGATLDDAQLAKQNLMNFQIQLTRRQGVIPMTRGYIHREEARLRGIERGTHRALRMAGE